MNLEKPQNNSSEEVDKSEQGELEPDSEESQEEENNNNEKPGGNMYERENKAEEAGDPDRPDF